MKYLVFMLISSFVTLVVRGHKLSTCDEEKYPNHVCKIDQYYDASKVPMNNFHMNCTVSIYDISEIDEVDHSITIFMNVYLRWFDPRLHHSNLTNE